MLQILLKTATLKKEYRYLIKLCKGGLSWHSQHLDLANSVRFLYYISARQWLQISRVVVFFEFGIIRDIEIVLTISQ